MSSLIVEVVRIDKLEKHPNADRLEIATVKGWECIVAKDTYKLGQLVVFIPPDAMVSEDMIKQYDLSYLKGSNRIGTVKLRGIISQGLILPVASDDWKVGTDVADYFGITKWVAPEPTASGSMNAAKGNPLFSKYTNIENQKNYPDIFNVGDEVIITEKIHGSNARFGNVVRAISKTGILGWIEKLIRKFKKTTHEFVVGSHNVQLSLDAENAWTYVAKKYDIANKLPKNTIVYGEIFGKYKGKGIQDLTYGAEDTALIIFDVKIDGEFLSYPEMAFFCQDLGLPAAPILYKGEYSPELLELRKGKSLLDDRQIREGIVVKPLREEHHRKLGRKVLKAISEDYLTRKNGTEYQ